MTAMNPKEFGTMKKRSFVAARKASDALKKRLGDDIPNINPDDFKPSEYHNLRWGWFYYMIHKSSPELLVKVAYRYKTKDFCVTTFSRVAVDYSK